MLVGLVSLTFFFGGLILAYGLIIQQQLTWQRFKVPGVLWAGLGFLVLSSGFLESARYALRRALVVTYRERVAITVALAFGFLTVQVIAAVELLRQGVAAAGNPHGSVFYIFMAIHGAHLGVGIGWLVYLWLKARALLSGTEQDLRRHRRAAAAAAMFWHFMGGLWLVLFFFLHRWTTPS